MIGSAKDAFVDSAAFLSRMTVDHGQQTSTATSLFATVSSEPNIDPVRFADEHEYEQWKSSVAVSLRMSGGLSAAMRETVKCIAGVLPFTIAAA